MKWWMVSIRNKRQGRRCRVVSGWHYLPVNSLAMNMDTGHLKHGCLIHLTMKPFSRCACHLIKAAASIISGLLHTNSRDQNMVLLSSKQYQAELYFTTVYVVLLAGSLNRSLMFVMK